MQIAQSEEIRSHIDGFQQQAVAVVPVKQVYQFADLRNIADQVLNGAYHIRTLDKWLIAADVVRGKSPRSALYDRNDLHWFVIYIAFKLNMGRKQAHAAYVQYANEH